MATGLLTRFSASTTAARAPSEIEDVIRNLQAVLNAHEGFSSFLPLFGLGNYQHGQGRRDPAAALIEEILGNITRYEPRIRDPRLQVLGRDSELHLHLELRATIGARPHKLRVRLHALLGGVTVTEVSEP